LHVSQFVPSTMSSHHEFQSIPVASPSPSSFATSNALQSYFASRTDHRIPLIDFLRQQVDTLNHKFSDDIPTYIKTGLDINVARKAYEQQGPNMVTSPQNCPAVLCCLLPCLNKTPKMKAFHNNCPDSCTVTRLFVNGGGGGSSSRKPRRLVMDSVSLVVGDIVTLYPEDLVPADCRVLTILDASDAPLEVDVSVLFAPLRHQRQRSVLSRMCTSTVSGENNILEARNMLLTGATILSGTALCIVTATGENTVWSSMVASNQWPPVTT
jgi:hypothetical protein